MKLSLVATLYQSELYIEEFCQRAAAVAQKLVGDNYEIILVNDGSPDDSLDVAVSLAEHHENISVIDLSRNFGHHQAMMTGLAYAQGEKVFLIDSDLEEEPEWLDGFYSEFLKNSADVVYGVQLKRKGGVFERITGGLFYRLFRLLTGVAQPDNIVTARLMSRRYVDALLMHSEREINIGGLWILTGFRQCAVAVTKHQSSPTTYSFSRKVSHLVNAVTSFSSKPLVFTFYSGLFISLGAFFYILYIVAAHFFMSPPGGYTSLIASIWLSAGLVIFFVGVQGIYVAKIFSEVKQRPLAIVRHVYRGQIKE